MHPKRAAYQNIFAAPAGVAQWTELQPGNQRVVGSIPSQGTHLGCGSGNRLFHTRFFYPSFSVPFPLSKNK